MNFYNNCDVVLWDSISTGFAECVSAKVPAMVFNSLYEYSLTSKNGKKVNDGLHSSGIVCYNVDEALNTFEKIVNNYSKFILDSSYFLEKFKGDLATPVSKSTWHKRYKNFNKFIK